MISEIIGLVMAVCSFFGGLLAWYVRVVIGKEIGALEKRMDAKLTELTIADVKSQAIHEEAVRLSAVVNTHELNNARARHELGQNIQSNMLQINTHEQRLLSLETLYPTLNGKLDKLIDLALSAKRREN